MKIKGLQICISPTLPLVLGLMVLTDRTGIGLLTVMAALLHEAGHLIAARALGIRAESMRFGFLGMRIDVGDRLLSYADEWLLCAAGPFVSLVGAAVVAPLWGMWESTRYFSCASMVLGLLNLLPIRTFDGGRMLECFLLSVVGTRATQRIMAACSFLFLFLLWATAVYFLLRVGDGLSLFCFSLSLLFRFFDGDEF